MELERTTKLKLKKVITYLSYLLFIPWILYVIYHINELPESTVTVNYFGIFVAFLILPKILPLNNNNA